MKVNRPKTFAEFQGKANLETVKRLRIAVSAAKKRGEPLGHVMLYGNAGTGKSSLAYILANEMGSELKTITGGTVRSHKDLWCILFDIHQKQQRGSNKMLFVDEVHCLAKGDIPEEVYYGVLEDFKFFHNLGGSEVKVGSSVFEVTGNVSILEPFTIIGATTAPGYLSKPLRDRFRISCFLKEYSEEDIRAVVKRYADAEKIPCEEDALAEIAKRARGNPRVSVNFLLGCYDLMTSRNAEKITKDIVFEEMALQHIDSEGLTDADLRVLKTLAEHEKGLGLRNLAGCANIHSSTIEELIEPFLKLRGYMEVRHKRFITERGLKKLKGLA